MASDPMKATRCSFERSKMVFNRRERLSQANDRSTTRQMPAGMNRPSRPRAMASTRMPSVGPILAAKADAPDRHDGLAQRRSGQRRPGSRSCRPTAVPGHGLQFHPHVVDKGETGRFVRAGCRQAARTKAGHARQTCRDASAPNMRPG